MSAPYVGNKFGEPDHEKLADFEKRVDPNNKEQMSLLEEMRAHTKKVRRRAGFPGSVRRARARSCRDGRGRRRRARPGPARVGTTDLRPGARAGPRAARRVLLPAPD